MSEKKTPRWPVYSLAFLALWSGNVAISLASKLSMAEVRPIVFRDVLAPVIITLIWYFLSFSKDNQ
jgi:hypothetical protein